jgi:biotin transport system permease protein
MGSARSPKELHVNKGLLMAGRIKRGVLKHGALKRETPFGYRQGKTILHRMPAGLKLIFVILISAFAFASVYGLAASILLVLIACALARIPPHSLLKGSKPLVILSLCIILLRTILLEREGIAVSGLHIPFISREGFLEGLLTAPGLFVPFAAAALLFSVTTMKELRLSLALVEKRVTRFFSPHREHTPFFSLGISLMLGFIPRFFEMWDDANLACDSRSCKRGLRRLFLLIPLVTERMMEASANTALALEARAFGNN